MEGGGELSSRGCCGALLVGAFDSGGRGCLTGTLPLFTNTPLPRGDVGGSEGRGFRFLSCCSFFFFSISLSFSFFPLSFSFSFGSFSLAESSLLFSSA